IVRRPKIGLALTRILVGFALALLAPSGLLGAEPAERGQAVALVSRLSWDSVEEDCWVVMLVAYPTGPVVRDLILIGKPASAALIDALEDPDRAVAAHLTLCAIWSWPESCPWVS